MLFSHLSGEGRLDEPRFPKKQVVSSCAVTMCGCEGAMSEKAPGAFDVQLWQTHTPYVLHLPPQCQLYQAKDDPKLCSLRCPCLDRSRGEPWPCFAPSLATAGSNRHALLNAEARRMRAQAQRDRSLAPRLQPGAWLGCCQGT